MWWRFLSVVLQPEVLFILLIVIEIISVIMLGVKWNSKAHISVEKIITACILIFIILFIATYLIFANFPTNTHKESPVDISPIADVRTENLVKLESIIENLKDIEFIEQYSIERIPGDDPELRAIHCKFLWSRTEPFTRLDIYITVYKDEQAAIDVMQRSLTNQNEKFIYVENVNNTDILLFHSRIINPPSLHSFASTTRLLRSRIRVGNAVILLTEHIDYYALSRNASSEFIRLLCAMMRE